jgi:hypothetical protein
MRLPREHFVRRVLHATLPLLIWIAHFGFSYGLAAAQCSPVGLRAGGPDRLLLGVVTAAPQPVRPSCRAGAAGGGGAGRAGAGGDRLGGHAAPVDERLRLNSGVKPFIRRTQGFILYP